MRTLIAILFTCGLGAACARSEGKPPAAPEDSRTQSALDGKRATEDPEMFARALARGCRGVGSALGDFRATGKTSYEVGQGEDARSVTHAWSVVRSSDGAFAISRGEGSAQLSVMYVGGHLYLQEQQGPYHKRLPNSKREPEEWCNRVFLSSSDTLSMFGAVAVNPRGGDAAESIDVSLSLAERGGGPEDAYRVVTMSGHAKVMPTQAVIREAFIEGTLLSAGTEPRRVRVAAEHTLERSSEVTISPPAESTLTPRVGLGIDPKEQSPQ